MQVKCMPQSQSSAATDVGLQRNNNEDSYLSSPEDGLWIVADGMGGHAAGEVASSIVTNTIRDYSRDGKSLSEAIQLSHRAVLDAAANGQGGQGMGSTVVALKSENQQYKIGWVGDSRAYLWSPQSSDPLKLLSKDHSYVQMLYESGAISEDEIETHPEKNIITQCLGSMELDHVEVSIKESDWGNDDWILLCSDGLTDAVSDRKIEKILTKSATLNEASAALVRAALESGGKDNITVVLVETPDRKSESFQRKFKRLIAKVKEFFIKS